MVVHRPDNRERRKGAVRRKESLKLAVGASERTKEIMGRKKVQGTWRIPRIPASHWFTSCLGAGTKKGWRKKARSREERVVEGLPHDISRLYARSTPNFAELPYDSLYPILWARPLSSSYDSTFHCGPRIVIPILKKPTQPVSLPSTDVSLFIRGFRQSYYDKTTLRTVVLISYEKYNRERKVVKVFRKCLYSVQRTDLLKIFIPLFVRL